MCKTSIAVPLLLMTDLFLTKFYYKICFHLIFCGMEIMEMEVMEWKLCILEDLPTNFPQEIRLRVTTQCISYKTLWTQHQIIYEAPPSLSRFRSIRANRSNFSLSHPPVITTSCRTFFPSRWDRFNYVQEYQRINVFYAALIVQRRTQNAAPPQNKQQRNDYRGDERIRRYKMVEYVKMSYISV